MSGTYYDEQATSTERPEVHGRSVGDLIGEVSNDLSTLMRQELALAKAEVKAEATKTGKAAGMLGGAGFAGYMVALFASIALWWALANGMDEGWAALIVAALWAVVGAVLYSLGRSRLKSVHPKPERTVQTLKEVPDALKGN
jgi:Putative Actinobacterial Holin-X, holin superfamily III